MPFAIDDVERHNQGLTNSKKRQWVAVANSVLKKCMDEGGTDATCAPMAIRQANGVVAAHGMSTHWGGAANYTIREELLQGRTHLVVPVVMMVQGVHRGSHGPILHLADELGKFPGAWDGIPVVAQHPQEDGTNVSANQPHILDEYVVGRVFNTTMDGQRLRAEAWLDPEALARVSPEALEYIRKGKPLDVSVGVFTDEDMQAGDYNGEHYEAVARNHRADHLALLPGAHGACSWADGCGVRAYGEWGDLHEHKQGVANMQTYAIKFDGAESIPWTKPTLVDFGKQGTWSGLSQGDKADIANHFLIGDDSAANYGELMFPVVNPKSGKLNEQALRAVIGGRGAQANITAAQRISARRQAYRLLNSEFDAQLEVPATLAADIAAHEEAGLKELSRLGLAINGMGFRELSQAIQTKLDRMDDDAKIHFLEECFDSHFIYRVEAKGSPGLSGGSGGSLFKRNYTVAGDGTVEFTGEAVPVIKRVSYDPISQGGMRNMSKEPCCKEKVEMLIQTGFYGEPDRERLLTMEEAVIDMLMASVDKAGKDRADLEGKVTALEAEKGRLEANAGQQTSREQAIQTLKADLGDQDKLMAILPPQTKAVIGYSLRLLEAERDRKVQHILANTNEGVYTREGLAAMDDQGLDALARAIKAPADYSALAPALPAGSRSPQGYADEAVYPPDVQ